MFNHFLNYFDNETRIQMRRSGGGALYETGGIFFLAKNMFTVCVQKVRRQRFLVGGSGGVEDGKKLMHYQLFLRLNVNQI